MVSPDELIGEFMAANPKLTRDMIVVECGGPGNRLKEVRICFNKGGGLRGVRAQRGPAPVVLSRAHVRAAGAHQR